VKLSRKIAIKAENHNKTPRGDKRKSRPDAGYPNETHRCEIGCPTAGAHHTMFIVLASRLDVKVFFITFAKQSRRQLTKIFENDRMLTWMPGIS